MSPQRRFRARVSAALLATGCAAHAPDASTCRVAYPHQAQASADPFVEAQPVTGTSIAPDAGGGAQWACVHATHETRGLIATGGPFPCLAAIGDVRQSAAPDASADACPSWRPSYTVALFSAARTHTLRAAGTEDACCYELPIRVVE